MFRRYVNHLKRPGARMLLPLVDGLDRLRDTTSSSTAVFMFHRFPATTVAEKDLRRSLELMRKRRVDFPTAEDYALRGVNRTGSAVITIDDGHQDQEQLAEIFLDYDIAPTIFLIGGFVNAELWLWDDQLKWAFDNTDKLEVSLAPLARHGYIADISTPEKKYEVSRYIIEAIKVTRQPYEIVQTIAERLGVPLPVHAPDGFRPMTWETIRSLHSRGVRFGNHGWSHTVFSAMEDDEIEEEVAKSEDVITKNVPMDRVFAIPTGRIGDYFDSHIAYLKDKSYSVFSTQPRGARQVDSVLPRITTTRTSAETNLRTSSTFLEIEEFYHHRNGNIFKLKHYSANKTRAVCKKISNAKRIIFVCTGNVCRSPFAEFYARKLGFSSISAGLKTDAGTPANSSAKRIARTFGVDLSDSLSSSFGDLDLAETDLLVGFEPSHKSRLVEASNTHGCESVCFHEFYKAIPDPFGKADSQFEECFNDLSRFLDLVVSSKHG